MYNYFMGIYFFYGDEDYLLDNELKKYSSKLDKNFVGMNYKVFDNLPYSDFISTIRSTPMMFGKMMIVINCTNLLSESLTDGQINEISESLELNTDNLDIFLIAKPANDKKTKQTFSIDKRKKLFKLFSKYNSKEFKSIPAYRTDDLLKYLSQFAKEKKIKLDTDAAMLIIDNLGNSLREYDNELDKLHLFAYPKTQITKEMVLQICNSNEDIFNLTDYIMNNKKSEVLKELRSLFDTKYPLEITAPIQTLLKQWIYILLNKGKQTNEEIAQHLNITPGRVYILIKELKNTNLKKLVQLRQKLAIVEYKIKSGQSFSPQEEIENAIIG